MPHIIHFCLESVPPWLFGGGVQEKEPCGTGSQLTFLASVTSCFLVLFLTVRAPARFLFLCLPLISDFLRPPSDHSFINHHQRHYLCFRIIASMGNMKWARELLFPPSLQGHMAEVPVLIWGEGKRSDKTS